MAGKNLGYVMAAGIIAWLGMVNVSSATLILKESEYENSLLNNSNSKVIDQIEYYFELDKSVYEQGENIEMLYRVTNLKDENVTFQFPTTLQKNFWIDKNGTNIWRAYDGGYAIITDFTLAPGENMTFTNMWNMNINQSQLLDVGNYIAIGGLYDGAGVYDYTKVGVSLEVVPEPFSITFLVLGSIGIMSKRKRRIILCS